MAEAFRYSYTIEKKVEPSRNEHNEITLNIELQDAAKNVKISSIPKEVIELSIYSFTRETKLNERHAVLYTFPDMSIATNLERIYLKNLKLKISAFPAFPNSVTHINMSNIDFKGSITLPINIDNYTSFRCNFTSIKNTPDKLRYLKIEDNNEIETLPAFSKNSNLEYLYIINAAKFRRLPPIPDNLLELNLEGTMLKSVPPLHKKLEFLTIKDNSKLKILGGIPRPEPHIICQNNAKPCKEMIKFGKILWALNLKSKGIKDINQRLELGKKIAEHFNLPYELYTRIALESYRSELCDPDRIATLNKNELLPLTKYANVIYKGQDKEQLCRELYEGISNLPGGPDIGLPAEEEINIPSVVEEVAESIREEEGWERSSHPEEYPEIEEEEQEEEVLDEPESIYEEEEE